VSLTASPIPANLPSVHRSGNDRIPRPSRRRSPEAPARARQSPQDEGRKALLSAGIPAYSRPAPAVLAIPFLGFLVFGFLLVVPFILAWGGEFLAHDPADEIRRTKQHEFLGRGVLMTRSLAFRTRNNGG
jgi:hypothetical protein